MPATIPDDLAARIVAALETIAETLVIFQQQFEERERKFAEAKAKKRDFGDKPFGKKPFGKPRFNDNDEDGGYGDEDFGDRPRRKSFGDKPARGGFGDKGGKGGKPAPRGRDRFSGGGTFRDFDGPPKKAGAKKPFGKKKF